MGFIAAIPAVLMGVSAAASAASGIASFVGARQQASYEQEGYQQQAAFQAQLAERNVALIDTQNRAEEDALKRDRERRLGISRARAGASGVQLEGSPLEALADEAAQYGRDASYLRYTNQVRRQDAVLGGQVAVRREQMGYNAAKVQGNQAFGSILGGFGQAGAIASGMFT